MRKIQFCFVFLIFPFLLSACMGGSSRVLNFQRTEGNTTSLERPRVLAVESFLADVTREVGAERIIVETLLPSGVDPHSYEPTPNDIAKIVESDLLVINGAGFEAWLENSLQGVEDNQVIIEASKGLISRDPQPGELGVTDHAEEIDPHFWLNPILMIKYVENIRDALIEVDPSGRDTYIQNTDEYINNLRDLDQWITTQMKQIPIENRIIVTNHESFGYFADQYNFNIIGTIIPSVSTNVAPSAQQFAQLIDQIRSVGAKGVFMEAGTNPKIAQQLAEETGIEIIQDLFTHSLTESNGPAPTYIKMMEHNVNTILRVLGNR